MVLSWGKCTSAGFGCQLWCRNAQNNQICLSFTFLLFCLSARSALLSQMNWGILNFSTYTPNTQWGQITGPSAPITAISTAITQLYQCPYSHLSFALREILGNMKWLLSSGLLLSHSEHGVLLFWGEGELATAKERKSLLKVPLSPGSSIHSTSVKLLLRCWGSLASYTEICTS